MRATTRRLLALAVMVVGCAQDSGPEPTPEAADAPEPESPAEATTSTGTSSGTSTSEGGELPGLGSTGDPSVDDTSSGGEPKPTVPASDPVFSEVLGPAQLPHCIVPNTYGPGLAWADVDGDGRLDLFTPGGDCPSTLMLNAGDGTFEPSPSIAALEGVFATTGAVFADYDNDGWIDLYLLRRGPNLLLRNTGSGDFEDVTEGSGVAGDNNTVSAAWGDFDGDGDLDLFAANMLLQPDALLRNEGDGTFTDISHLVEPIEPRQTLAVAWLDYDNDADADLYVINDKEVGNALWRNDGPGCGQWCFTNVGPANGASYPADGMGIGIADIDLDGDLDLSYSDLVEQVLLRSEVAQGQDLFTNVTREAGLSLLSEDWGGWGTIFFDIDIDGLPDLLVVGVSEPNFLYRNDGLGHFEDVSAGCGCVEADLFTFGAAYADYDADGRPDFAVGNRSEGFRLYHNDTDTGDHRWLTVKLVGGGDVNRDAVGARVYVNTDGGRTLMAEVKAGSSVGSNNMLPLHFGLGLERIDSVTVRWPNGLYEQPAAPADNELWVHTYPGA